MMEKRDNFEDFLHEMMQEVGHERAPDGFTQRVMGEVVARQATKSSVPWKPLISLSGWIGIALGLICTTLLAIFVNSSPATPRPGQVAAEKAFQSAVGALEGIQFPSILVLTLGTVFLLFMLDRVLSQRRKNQAE